MMHHGSDRILLACCRCCLIWFRIVRLFAGFVFLHDDDSAADLDFLMPHPLSIMLPVCCFYCFVLPMLLLLFCFCCFVLPILLQCSAASTASCCRVGRFCAASMLQHVGDSAAFVFHMLPGIADCRLRIFASAASCC